MARTQIPGSQVLDSSIETEDIEDLAVTEAKLSVTGVAPGSYTLVTISNKGRVFGGSNPTTLTGLGVVVPLNDLSDIVLTNPEVDQVLSYDGTNWVNVPIESVDSRLHLYSENPQSQVDAVALGYNSIALGSGSSAGASNSFAFGDQSLTRIDGGLNFAAGRFATQGDAQTGKYLLRTHTVNSTPTELFLNGTAGNERLTIADDSTWVFEVTIVAHETNTANPGHAGFRLKGVIYKTGAVNTSILGAVTKEVLSAHSSWDVAVTADNTNGSLKITATGEAGKIIRWLAIIETTEVTN